MWYSIGCAFNINHMFENFKYEKLNFDCNLCEYLIGNRHRHFLVKKVFRECLKLVISDIIEYNITFWLPTQSRRSCLKMKRVRGKAFKNLFRSGKWRNIDFIRTNFTGNEIGFFMYGNRTPRVKTVYLNPLYKDRIAEKVNKGMNYGDSINDRYIKDYYERVHSLFPKLTISDIKRILNYGWKSLYLHNSYGGDTIIKDNNIWCYIGQLKKEPLKHFLYYIFKLCIKIRVLYKRHRIKWDGYYYFAISKYQKEQIESQKKKRGRPRKYYKFTNIMLHKILEECKISEFNKQYIYRIPYKTQLGYKCFLRELVTDQAELIITRNPLKFNDIIYEKGVDYKCI